MPPSTDCSAGISCGGLRLPSDSRVASIGSRCVTDKAAVLHCVPLLNPCRRCLPHSPDRMLPVLPQGSRFLPGSPLPPVLTSTSQLRQLCLWPACPQFAQG